MNAKWVAIVAVGVMVVAALAGFGGFTYGRSVGRAQALTARTNFLQARGVGGGQGGQNGAGGQGGTRAFNPNNFANGQVKTVSGDTIELSTATEVLKVQVDGQTQIQKMATGAVSDIKAGDRITVQGTRTGNGAFTATMIQIGRGGGPNQGGGGAPQQ